MAKDKEEPEVPPTPTVPSPNEDEAVAATEDAEKADKK